MVDKRYYATITKLIKRDLRKEGTSKVPYIGTFTLKGTSVSFKASRHLKNRLKGVTATEKRLEKGRAFGGEQKPSKSIPLWSAPSTATSRNDVSLLYEWQMSRQHTGKINHLRMRHFKYFAMHSFFD